MGINFPASPTVGQKYPQPAVAGVPVYTWDGEKWTTVGGSIAAYAPPADAVPLMDATPGLVGTTTEYAREDHVHPTDTSRASYDAMAYSGMQINGGMGVRQEFGPTPATGIGYFCDGWTTQFGGSMTSSAVASTTALFPGFQYCIIANTGTAQPSLGAGNYSMIGQAIEGDRIFRLGWGAANAQPITVGFWSAHTPAGLYSVMVQNLLITHSYCAGYTQASAGVPQYNTITIPSPPIGSSWHSDFQVGMYLYFIRASGSTYTASSANTWLAGNYLAVPGQVNGVAASPNDFILTGVTILPGTQAPTAAQSPNIMRPYDQELVTCKRYFEALNGSLVGTGHCIGGNVAYVGVPYLAKRSAPTVTPDGQYKIYNVTGAASTVLSWGGVFDVGTHGCLLAATCNGLTSGQGVELFYTGGPGSITVDARL